MVDRIKDRLDPPTGVTASVVGLPVLAADANAALSSPWRRALTLLAALAAVFLVLLAFRRSRREAAVPLIPIALATGWSAGVLFLLGQLPGPLSVELNPMSVTLGALVIAISTEFSVLLSARYRQEREAGAPPARAIELTYTSTGAAVLASGVTAIAGFAALIASDIRMLRDFGILTVVDLSVSLLGVMLVLPAALVWAEQHGRVLAARPQPAAVPARAARRASATVGRAAPPRGSPAPARGARLPLPAPRWLRTASATSAAASRPPQRRRALRGGGPPPPRARHAAQGPPRGAADRQPVRVGRRDRAVHGHRGAAVHHRAAEHGRGPARARSAGKVVPDFAAPLATGDTGGRRQRLPEGAASATTRPAPVPGLPDRQRGDLQRVRGAQAAAGAHLRGRQGSGLQAAGGPRRSG